MIDRKKLMRARRERAEVLEMMLGPDHPLTIEAKEQAKE